MPPKRNRHQLDAYRRGQESQWASVEEQAKAALVASIATITLGLIYLYNVGWFTCAL